jgi:hypothetical protein
LGGASLVSSGDDSACVRWWWSKTPATSVRPFAHISFRWSRGWSAQRKRTQVTHLASSYATMKHQHHGCPPLQMFARAVAEQQSLSLYSRCRHPLERDMNADHGESRGWFAVKLDWKCCVMRSEGQGCRGSCGQNVRRLGVNKSADWRVIQEHLLLAISTAGLL